jgi:DNA-binding NarL/FixJ family response regulator
MEGNGGTSGSRIRVHIACRNQVLREVVRHTAERCGWALVPGANGGVVVTDQGERSGRNVVVIVDPGKPAQALRVLRRVSRGEVGGALSANRLLDDLQTIVELAGSDVVAFSGVLSSYADECPALSSRQEQVLRLISFGLSYPTIAERLRVSLATVKRDVSSLFELFGCANQSQLITLASDAGFLQS